MAHVIRATHPADLWPCYVLNGATPKDGQTALAAGFANSAALKQSQGSKHRWPQAIYVGTAGYLYLKDKAGTERTLYAAQGVIPIAGITDIDGTNSTATELVFLYQ